MPYRRMLLRGVILRKTVSTDGAPNFVWELAEHKVHKQEVSVHGIFPTERGFS